MPFFIKFFHPSSLFYSMNHVFFLLWRRKIAGKNIKGMWKSRNLHYGEICPRTKKGTPAAVRAGPLYICNVIREMTRVNKKGK